MKLYSRVLIFVGSLHALPALSQCAPSTNTTSTVYNENNGQRGCMFDITTTNTITINCFDAALYSGTTANYEIYYRAGTFIGNESNAGAWTLVGTTTGLTSAGINVPTPIPIPVNVTIPAGQTYGFYITNDIGGGTRYTDGVGNSTLLASDANLSLTGGVGKSYPFGLTFNYRDFNGAVHYTLGIPLPVELSSFWVTPLENEARLDWQTASESNNDYFTVERSADAKVWEELSRVNGAGNSTVVSNYSWTDERPLKGMSYYRLIQTDFDGKTTTSEVRSLFQKPILSENFVVYPNPSEDFIMLQGSGDDLGEISAFDLLGRPISHEIPQQESLNGVQLDISSIPEGPFILRSGEKSCIVFKK